MFNLQPGQGLGFTGSKQIALGLGGISEIIEPPIQPPVPTGGGGGRGRSPTNVIRKEGGYRPNHQDKLDRIRMERIKREDDDILEFIKVILTKGLL